MESSAARGLERLGGDAGLRASPTEPDDRRRRGSRPKLQQVAIRPWVLLAALAGILLFECRFAEATPARAPRAFRDGYLRAALAAARLLHHQHAGAHSQIKVPDRL